MLAVKGFGFFMLIGKSISLTELLRKRLSGYHNFCLLLFKKFYDLLQIVQTLYPFALVVFLLIVYFQVYLLSHRIVNLMLIPIALFFAFILSLNKANKYRLVLTIHLLLLFWVFGRFLIFLSDNYLFEKEYFLIAEKNAMTYEVTSLAKLNDDQSSITMTISPLVNKRVKLKFNLFLDKYAKKELSIADFSKGNEWKKAAPRGLFSTRNKIYKIFAIGRQFKVKLKFSRIKNALSIHSFDNEKYNASKGIFFEAKSNLKDLDFVQVKREFSIASCIVDLRLFFEDRLAPYFDLDCINLYKACILADRDYWDKSLNKYFASSSLSHILAASAFHLALYLSCLYYFFKKTSLSLKNRYFLSILVAIFFLLVSLGSKSLLRCVFYFIYCILAKLRHKSIDPISALNQSFLLIIFFNPLLLLNTSFVMSYLAASAVFLALRLSNYFLLRDFVFDLKKIRAYLPKKVSKSIESNPKILRSISKVFYRLIQSLLIFLSVQLALSPFVLQMTAKISLLAYFYNLIVGFMLICFIFFMSLFVVFTYIFVDVRVASFLSQYPKIFYQMIMKVVKSSLSSPLRIFLLKTEQYVLFTALFFILLIFISFLIKTYVEKHRLDRGLLKKYSSENCEDEKCTLEDEYFEKGVLDQRTFRKLVLGKRILGKRPFVFVTALVLISLIFIFINSARNIPLATLRFLSGGTGDLAILEFNNKRVLFDAAKEKDASTFLYNYLAKQIDSKVDLAIISHLHEDHYGGVKFLLRNSLVDSIYMRNKVFSTKMDKKEEGEVLVVDKELCDLAERVNCKVIRANDFKYIKLAQQIDVNLLNEDISYSKDENGRSLCQILKIGDFKVLFTGDIGADDEIFLSQLLQESGNNYFDILKVAHHGSKHSSTTYFLDKVNFDYAVITVGTNHYGHPSKEAISRLKSVCQNVYRTDRDGDVIFKFYSNHRYDMSIEKRIVKVNYLDNFIDTFRLVS